MPSPLASPIRNNAASTIVRITDNSNGRSQLSPPPLLNSPRDLRRPRIFGLGSNNATINTAIANMVPFYREHCTYFPAMAGWFLFSALLSSYNKFVFGEDHFKFPCPLLMTSIHFGTQWLFSVVLCVTCPAYWGGHDLQVMSWKQWAMLSIPCGLVTSGDVGLSNLSLVHISLTFYTMVKASTPIFVLIWAYLFRIENITLPLVGVIMWIAMGELLTVAGEVEFSRLGFILCLSASMLSGARWTLVQCQLQSLDPPLKTTVATMKLLAPSMFFSMFIFSLFIEKPWIKLSGYDTDQLISVFGLGLIGALLAICMILCEFYLIMHASAMILMIGGVLKELLTIMVGVSFFKDKLNRVNVAGCCLVFMGVMFYKLIFHMQKYQHGGSDDNVTLDGLHSPSSGDSTINLVQYQMLDRSDIDDDINPEQPTSNNINNNNSLSNLQNDIETTVSILPNSRAERVEHRKSASFNSSSNNKNINISDSPARYANSNGSDHSSGNNSSSGKLVEIRNGSVFVKSG